MERLKRVSEVDIEDSRPDDTQFMLRFKEGDREAFEILFKKYTRPIINYIYRFIPDQSVAEELAQEVFIRVWRGASKYEPRARFSTWLYTIATNLIFKELRQGDFRKVVVSLETSEGAEKAQTEAQPETPEETLQSAELKIVIEQALEKIPPRQRAAIIMSKFQGLSYKEIGTVLRCSEKSVKSLIFRARETLRTLMEEYI